MTSKFAFNVFVNIDFVLNWLSMITINHHSLLETRKKKIKTKTIHPHTQKTTNKHKTNKKKTTTHEIDLIPACAETI